MAGSSQASKGSGGRARAWAAWRLWQPLGGAGRGPAAGFLESGSAARQRDANPPVSRGVRAASYRPRGDKRPGSAPAGPGPPPRTLSPCAVWWGALGERQALPRPGPDVPAVP